MPQGTSLIRSVASASPTLRMRVLIASAWDPKSGVVTVYRSLARHLAQRGVRFSAFAFDGWSDETWWTFCDELIDGQSTTLAQVLMSGRYDLVHCIETSYSPPYGVEVGRPG